MQLLGSFRLGFSGKAFPGLAIPHPKKSPVFGCLSAAVIIRCGLRGWPRKPLWQGQVLSTEAVQAVRALKLAKFSPKPKRSSFSPNTNTNRMKDVFRYKLGRLLKADQIAELTELRRQNEWEITLQQLPYN